jgi:glutamate-ammonia-ligase adenylyltransferase
MKMHDFKFADTQKQWPKPGSSNGADTGFDRLRESIDQTASEEAVSLKAAIENPESQPALYQALTSLFGNSPYLTDCILKDVDFTCQLLSAGPDNILESIKTTLNSLHENIDLTTADLSRQLRIAKRQISLTVGIADITEFWPLEKITRALSDFADRALQIATRHLIRDLANNGVIDVTSKDEPENDSGYIVLALGKLGSHALNYSSDIDLIIFFDPTRTKTDKPDNLQRNFIRLTQNLVKIMEDRTADGYVFRTDLRLRPDPGATPIAVSTEAAEAYYESLGQNWERAAMIKARPVAGDIERGHEFIDHLKPFIWRKNLDFAAIQDVHSIKRQINAHRGSKAITVAGHNVKLGRGGIREIEFFAQTQQLIWGGRITELQVPSTQQALRALAKEEQIKSEIAEELIKTYQFLRRVEHRIQMTNDEQTHDVPKDSEALHRLAIFLAYEDTESFEHDYISNLKIVEKHYAGLFEEAPTLGAQNEIGGNLVFTGVDSDPDTLQTIRSLGFSNPDVIDTSVRGWHHGRYRSTHNTRAREILTELMPVLLQSLGKTAQPDAAFLKFDKFLAHLPAGIQLFSMFRNNPQLLTLVAGIMGDAPRLAEHLSRRPSTLDSVLTNDFFETPPSLENLKAELTAVLERTDTVEELLDASRRWANDRRFQIGVQMLQGFLKPEDAALAQSNIADAAISALYPRIAEVFIEQHGSIEQSDIVIIAMGKMGGREMTATSDLDLIFLYDAPDSAETSDGRKPLIVSQYFARLSQRMINALKAQTAEGTLYEVDMRLRPSGSSGPIATNLEAFIRYHRENAWTWEHMALTRARVIYGTGNLTKRIEDIIQSTLTKPRDNDKLLIDVATMRKRIEQEHHTKCLWAAKHFRGGLVDIEFLTQCLQLKYAHEHPNILDYNTASALIRLRDANLIESQQAEILLTALELWQATQSMLRLTLEGEVTNIAEDALPAGLQRSLANYCGFNDFDFLKETLTNRAKAVYDVFIQLIKNPAEDLAQSVKPKQN